jgi:cytochrome c peroxidase
MQEKRPFLIVRLFRLFRLIRLFDEWVTDRSDLFSSHIKTGGFVRERRGFNSFWRLLDNLLYIFVAEITIRLFYNSTNNVMKNTITHLLLLLTMAACRQPEEFSVRDDINLAGEILAMEEALTSTVLINNYHRTLPTYLTNLGLQVAPVDDLKAGVGRVLFYDRNLSKDRTVSCASCHRPQNAFSDYLDFSVGVEGRKTDRNSMPLANVASFSAHYQAIDGKMPLLFWDERVPDVVSQSRQTFANEKEMGLPVDRVVERVREQLYYAPLWRKVYGHFEPKEAEILDCLQEFVGAMGSHNSRLDRALDQAFDLFEVTTSVEFDTLETIRSIYYGPNDTTITVITNMVGLPGLTISENRGRDLFVANCTKCHSPVRAFQEVFAACNGLEMGYNDQGLGWITGLPLHNGVFKSPSLRNIALTAPYMHDGRFKTLTEVVDFYSDGIQAHPNLHPLLMRNGVPGLQLSPIEKLELVSFLHTLTDGSIAHDNRFSNPFRRP